MDKNSITLSQYAKICNVSKAWLSRISKNKSKISFEIAQRILKPLNYKIEILDNNNKIIKLNRLNHEI